MATFNLAGTTTLALSPITHQADQASKFQISQVPHVLKRTIALTSIDYWRVGAHNFSFITRGTVVRVRPAVALRGVTMVQFNNELHNIAKIFVRTWPLSGAVSFTMGSSHVMGRTWKKDRIHSLTFAQTDSHNIRTAYSKTGTSAVTFVSAGGVKHNYKSRTGSTALTFSNSGTTSSGRALTGITNLAFGQVGTTIPVSPESSVSFLIFAQTNSVRITKNVRATLVLAFQNGGYAVV